MRLECNPLLSRAKKRLLCVSPSARLWPCLLLALFLCLSSPTGHRSEQFDGSRDTKSRSSGEATWLLLTDIQSVSSGLIYEKTRSHMSQPTIHLNMTVCVCTHRREYVCVWRRLIPISPTHIKYNNVNECVALYLRLCWKETLTHWQVLCGVWLRAVSGVLVIFLLKYKPRRNNSEEFSNLPPEECLQSNRETAKAMQTPAMQKTSRACVVPSAGNVETKQERNLFWNAVD